MARITIDDVIAFGGPAYEIATEDGPGTTCDYYVAVTVTGVDYVHPQRFRYQEQDRAERLAEQVRVTGTIDPALWMVQPPRMSLEERFGLYAVQEAEVRQGFRPEWDMYHGID